MSATRRFESFPVLSGGRSVLRRVVHADVPDVREITFYDGVAAEDDARAGAIVAAIDADYERGESVHWGICPRPSDRVVGTVGFYRGYPGDVGEIGYVLRPDHRGRGLMAEAVRLAATFGREKMGLAAIVAYVEPGNHASVAVLRRAGFAEVPSLGGRRTFLL